MKQFLYSFVRVNIYIRFIDQSLTLWEMRINYLF